MRVKFSAEIEIPDGTPEIDIEAWLKYELGERGQLKAGNAMNYTSLDSVRCENVRIDWVKR